MTVTAPRRRLLRGPVAAVLAVAVVLVLAAVLVLTAGAWPQEAVAAAAAGGCTGGVEADLTGSGDTAVVSGRASTACDSASSPRPGPRRPYRSDEIACSPDQTSATEGMCSEAPCRGGLSFALQTLHHPDGRAEPAGYACMRLERARVAPNLAAADVFAAVRRVRLPTGAVRTAPSGRGLVNLPSRFWLAGVAQAPVDLPLAGSMVHAEFQPVEYRWSFGSGSRSETALPALPALAGTSGRAGDVQVAFSSRGRFAVMVETTWSAAAFLDGRYVGQVEGLKSRARIGYPVAELRAVLSG